MPRIADSPHLAVVGGGPAGLMAAEVARARGLEVDVYERMGSVGRKFLLAGKGGLNLTHAEGFEDFVSRYRERRHEVEGWLCEFGAEALREWARGLGVDTFVGSSGRVFPADLKAAPLLRGWVRRLRAQGVRFHAQHRLLGLQIRADACPALRLETPAGERVVEPDAAVLALGGGSWPALGSDGSWVDWMARAGVDVAPLVPSNSGFEVAWSAHFRSRFSGAAVKPVALCWLGEDGRAQRRQGEFVVCESGVEGSLVYAASADLRAQCAARVGARVHLDLAPGRDAADLAAALARPRRGRSVGEHLRRGAGLDGVRAALVFEKTPKAELADAQLLAQRIKRLPLDLLRPRPLAEAISSAGGVRLEALDGHLMLRRHPGLFCAGEMLDWEAPTGGYLLTASFASGWRAGQAAARWLTARDGYPSPRNETDPTWTC
ncbi:MAG: TIGR03862 family flavoprotein [Panacagrimonas sp.]